VLLYETGTLTADYGNKPKTTDHYQKYRNTNTQTHLI
jgi:hypothetical protein